MTNDDFKKILDEALNPIKKQLNDSDTGLVAINGRLDSNTAAVMELEQTVKGYGDMYKINDSNIRKIEKRVETVEEDAGIKAPFDLLLTDVS